MASYSIGMVVGSARKDSINRRLADALAKLAGPDFEFRHLRVDDLPIYNQDIEDPAPASVERLRKDIRSVDGLLFVSPEYNRSLTPLLVNALSWGSRPYGHNSFRGKPGAIAGASIGPIGTAAGQGHLRDLLGVLDVRLIGQPEAYIHVTDGFFDADGAIADEGRREAMKKKMGEFADWVKLVTDAKKKAA